MKLSAWIKEKGGNPGAATLLGVRRNCCYAWVHGIALPRPEVMKRIVKVTRGKVTYSEMIDEYLAKHSRLKKYTPPLKRKVKRIEKMITKPKRAEIDPGF